ncbi:MAG TPA: alternative ribosome rescue aminoacyl-tRNA hydrolase ArfB [Acidimicrobiales bacterium]|nr:alternative ribosome rescue aminoacyl-tRNA hydrolase ArfB [Acidimicrobiales bacterium]
MDGAPTDDLPVASGVVIPAAELRWRFGPSGGPGGQHANRAHTRVELSVDLAGSPTLPAHARDRLVARLGDEVRVTVDEERSQSRNRSLARARLAEKLAGALVVPRSRRPTRPTAGSKRRRLDDKRRRGDLKRERRAPPDA